MINKVIVLENNDSYLMLLKEIVDNKTFYIGVKLRDEKYTNEFKLFLEKKKDNEIFLEEIKDEELLKVLVNSYVLNNI